MDITPQDNTQQSISDDQELAKALAGVMPGVAQPEPAAPATEEVATPEMAQPEIPELPKLDFEETPAPTAELPTPAAEEPVQETAPVSQASSDLDSIKKDALQELRPLMDKVDLPAEEKFDTYLMLIRSTDDASLIGPAHATALEITDEKRRATALLEIIKEIDYLSHPKQAE